MLEQLRLEDYGCCCKMRVTTAVSILGWVGIIVSVLAIIGGIIIAVVPPAISSQLLYIIPGAVIILIWLLPLIINSILIKRNRARSFGGVKSLIQVICKIILSLELISSIVLLFSMLVLIALATVGYNLDGIVSNINANELNLTSEEQQGFNQFQQLLQDGEKYEDACSALALQLDSTRQGLGEPGRFLNSQNSAQNESVVDPAAVLGCIKAASPIFITIFIIAAVFAFIWMVFLCLAIHGIRKNRKSLLNAYIIFNILLLVVPIALQILSLFTQDYPVESLIYVIPSIIGNIVVFLYHMGFFVVLYNMMDVSLDYGHEMKRI